MYEQHFGLKANPFTMSPDPRFLYQKSTHREALAALIYGIHERRGFITLVGEVGTGKTTLVNALLDLFHYSTRTILIDHTTVNREELLSMILYELRSPRRRQVQNPTRQDLDFWAPDALGKLSRVEMLHRFYGFLNDEQMTRRPPPILLIDEAQNLSVEVLEEIRLLTNLERPQQKLLQVVLVGQPELEKKLLTPELRALRQRIAVYARLEPLGQEETMEYVTHRLQIAGSASPEMFTDGALHAIWKASGGYPRVINILCEQSLVNTFGAREERVDEFLVAEAIRDVDYLSEAGLPTVGFELNRYNGRVPAIVGQGASEQGRSV